jgi:FMN phosphatase YigB (HAD superfamily)
MLFQKINPKVIVWDLDGTLHVSGKAADVMRKTFIQIIASEKNIAFESAESLFLKKTKDLNWSKATSLITKKNEWNILMDFEKRMNRSPFVVRQDNTLKLLEELNKFRHLILTNANYANCISTLKLMGFEKIGKDSPSPFEKIFAIDNTNSYKPKLDMFRKVLSYTKLHPQEHLIVGDSPATDILPAKRLNFKTCLVGPKHPMADFHLASIYELPALLSLRFGLTRFLLGN